MKIRSIALLSCVLVGCSSAGTPSEPPSTLGDARTAWARHSADYSFDFQRNCFCVREAVQPVTIEVRNGQITSVVSRETGMEVAQSGAIEWYTIEDLFGLIERAEREGQAVEVEYDVDGFPTTVTIGSLAADAGIEFTISNVEAL